MRRSVFIALLVALVAGGLGWSRLRSRTPRLPDRERAGDNPLAAARQRAEQLRDAQGRIPRDGLLRAREHGKRMPRTPAPAAASISRGAWTWIGPGNVGGRVRSILVHPTTPATMWAGSVGGGIWKSTNGGASWRPLDDFMANLAVAAMALDPQNPDVLYAGTGEGFFAGSEPVGDFQKGAGIFKSSDGGTTWHQLPATARDEFTYVNRLGVHPTSPQILLAATRSGLFRSTDGGASFTLVYPQEMRDVRFNPQNGAEAVAGSLGEAFYSTDAGATWRRATGLDQGNGGGGSGARPGSARVELAYARSAPTNVYASVDRFDGQIYRSTDGGRTFALVNTGSGYFNTGAGGQGSYDNALWVDPTNPEVVIVGGIDLWRSTDGGRTLAQISAWQEAPRSAHADHHVIVSHPAFDGTTVKTVFFGNDGGLYKADDVYTVGTVSASVGWQTLNHSFGVTQFYAVCGNASSGVIVGGTQDNGTLRYGGDPEAWTRMIGGDGGFCAADPTDPNYFYGELYYLDIRRSSNGGRTTVGVAGNLTDSQNEDSLFIAPILLDPNNPGRLLAGGASLWRSDDIKTAANPAWTAIKAPMGGFLSAIAVAAGASDLIWVGTHRGGVYKTVNGTAASPMWTVAVPGGAQTPGRYVMSIAIDPRVHDIVYVTYGGFATDNVWRTTDGGQTWAAIGGAGAEALPAAPVRSLAIDPNNPDVLYVGTEVGVFVSADAGGHWKVPHDGPANVEVDQLFFMKAKLVAGTHGRGVFTQDTCLAGAACDDGNRCTSGAKTCNADGVCSGGLPVGCDDANPCTDDACDPRRGCTHTPNTASCARDACSTADRCQAGACVTGAPVSCDDGNPCTDDSCDPTTGCKHANRTGACNADACTTGAQCQNGACTGGAPVSCDDGDRCTTDSCNPTTGCVHSARRPGCSQDGTAGGNEAGAADQGKGDGGCSATATGPTPSPLWLALAWWLVRYARRGLVRRAKSSSSICRMREKIVSAVLATLALAGTARAEVRTQELDYKQGATTLQGFVAWDAAAKGKRPGVLVVHEWWGHNKHAREQARRLAAAGYVAFALDMYGKGKLAKHPKDAQAFLAAAMKDPATMAARFAAAMEALKARPEVDARHVAAIGYCFGGAVVLGMARAGVELDAVVAFHAPLAANGPPAEKGKVKAQILVNTGADDKMVPAEQIAAFKKEMQAAGVKAEVIVHPGAKHSFTNPDADKAGMDALGYSAEADRKSFEAMLALFKQVWK